MTKHLDTDTIYWDKKTIIIVVPVTFSALHQKTCHSFQCRFEALIPFIGAGLLAPKTVQVRKKQQFRAVGNISQAAKPKIT